MAQPGRRSVATLSFLPDGPLEGISPSDLERLATLKVGEEYTTERVQTTLRRLYATELFYDIHVFADEEGSDGVAVEVRLFRRFLVGELRFEGQLGLGRPRLRRTLSIRPGQSFQEKSVAATLDELRALYRSQGFLDPQLTLDYRVDRRRALVDIVYRVQSGSRPRVGTVGYRVDGNQPSSLEDLKALLQTRPGGPYSPRVMELDRQRVESFLIRSGYLDASVDFAELTDLESDATRADLELRVAFGSPTAVEFRNWRPGEEQLEDLAVFRERSTAAPVIEETASQILDRLQLAGHLGARVRSHRGDSGDAEKGDVVFDIQPGRRHSLKAVQIHSNPSVPDARLRPLLEVRPAGLFARGRFSDRLALADSQRIADYYQRLGFLEAEVSYTLVEDRGWTLRYLVEEGVRSSIGELQILGNRELSTPTLLDQIESRAGGTFSPLQAGADRATLLTFYQNQGYRRVDIRTDVRLLQAASYAVVFEIEEGPRLFVEEVILSGNVDTRAGVVRDRVHLVPGQPFGFDALLQTETDLYQLAVFNHVQVREVPEPLDSKTLIVDMEESKRYSLVYGLGYSTFEGPRGTIGLVDNNFRGLASPLSLGARLSRQRQRGSLSYPLPQLRDRGIPTLFSLSFDNEEALTTRVSERTQALKGKPFDSLRFSFSSQTQRDLSRRESLFLRYELEKVRTSVPADLETSLEFFRQESDLLLSSISVSYLNESRDDPADPRQGFFLSGEFKLPNRFLGSRQEFARFLLSGQHYKTFHDRLTWANSIRLGFIKPFGQDGDPLVAISERFFSGGATSLRGLPQDLAGPLLTDSETGEIVLVDRTGSRNSEEGRPVPLGGNALAIFNSELRFPLVGRVSGAAFYDLGNVFETLGDLKKGSYTNTVGIGFQLRTPVGPVRFDAGYNPSPPELPGFKHWNFHFTLGHPF